MVQLPGKEPVEVKDRDAMAKKMNEFIQVIGSTDKIDTKTKVKKLQEFFVLNEQTLNMLGPEIYLRVKNELSTVITRLVS